MAVCDFTQRQDADDQGGESRRGIVTPASVMRELWYATDEGRNLTQAELEWLAAADQAGGLMLQNLQTVLSGVGCLILADAAEDKGLRSGALQSPSEVAEMLFTVGNMIDAAVGMIEIGQGAGYKAFDRRYKKRPA